MELGIRLSSVAGMADKGDCIADIGCDHGFVSIALVEAGVAGKMIACDINKGPLEHAKKNIESAGLSDRIDVRLGDGLSPVEKGECDGVIIAGMGGPLGLRILFDGRDKIKDYKQIILQLQSKLPLVRFVLDRWGFETITEMMVSEDGKFYPIMKMLPPKNADFYESADIEDFDGFLDLAEKQLRKEPSDYICSCTYGKTLLESKSPALQIFLGREEERLLSILEKLERSGEDNSGRIKEVADEIDTLMLAKWKCSGM